MKKFISKKNDFTIGEFVDLYQKIKQRAERAKTTMATIDRVINLLSEMHVNNLFLTQFNKDYVLKFIDLLKKKQLNNSSKKVYFSVFNSMMKKAMRLGYIEKNPCDMLDEEERIKPSYKIRNYLNREELLRLIKTPCRNDDVRRAFLFACFCGLRSIDIRNLRWNDIVFDKNIAFIPNLVQKKTKRPLFLPLNMMAQSFLVQKNYKDGLIFHLPSQGSVNDQIKKWTRRCGIAKKITFHSSRHTFATLALTLGGDIYTISKLLGHSTIQTTQIYAEVVNEKKIDLIKLFDQAFFKK